MLHSAILPPCFCGDIANTPTARPTSTGRWSKPARGPRHQFIARLGKLDGAEVAAARSWQDWDALLEGRPSAAQLELTATGSPASVSCWREVDVSAVRVERLRQFGRMYLGLALWRRLGLHTLLQKLLPAGREQIGWNLMACVLALGRFCAQPSELSLAERWYDDTALEDLLGVPLEKINDVRLYRGLDALLPHKDALCAHLLAQYRGWFGVRNIRIENCAFVRGGQNGIFIKSRGGQNGIFIKSRDGRGSFIENVTGENLTFGPRCGTFLGIDLMTKGIQAAEPVPGDVEKWTLAHNISFKNIKVDGVPTLIAGRNISAARPFDGLSLSNITGTCQRGITLANVVNADFKDINVTGYSGDFLSLTNVTGNGLEIKN